MTRGNLSRFVVTLLVVANWLSFAHAQSSSPLEDPPQSATQTTAEALKKLDQLVEQNRQLEKQNRELMDQIEILRRGLANEAAEPPEAIQKEQQPASARVPANQSGPSSAQAGTQVPAPAAGGADVPSGQEYGRNTTWNLYEPGRG